MFSGFMVKKIVTALLGVYLILSPAGQSSNKSYSSPDSFSITGQYLSGNQCVNGRDYRLIKDPVDIDKTILAGKTRVKGKEVWRTIGTYSNQELQQILYELGPISQVSI